MKGFIIASIITTIIFSLIGYTDSNNQKEGYGFLTLKMGDPMALEYDPECY